MRLPGMNYSSSDELQDFSWNATSLPPDVFEVFNTSNSSNITVYPLPIPSPYVNVHDAIFTVYASFLIVSVILGLLGHCCSESSTAANAKYVSLVTAVEVICICLLIPSMVHKRLCYEWFDCEVLIYLPTATGLCGVCLKVLANCPGGCGDFLSLVVIVGVIVLFNMAPSSRQIALSTSCVCTVLAIIVGCCGQKGLAGLSLFIVILFYCPFMMVLAGKIFIQGSYLHMYLMGASIFSLRTVAGG